MKTLMDELILDLDCSENPVLIDYKIEYWVYPGDDINGYQAGIEKIDYTVWYRNNVEEDWFEGSVEDLTDMDRKLVESTLSDLIYDMDHKEMDFWNAADDAYMMLGDK